MPFPDKLKSGESITFVNETKKIAVTAWQDSKVVKFVPNYSVTEDIGLKYQRRGAKTDTSLPQVAVDYRKYMRFVDAYRAITLNGIKRTSYRWVTISFFILDCVIINCWRVFVANNTDLPKRKQTVSEFLLVSLLEN